MNRLVAAIDASSPRTPQNPSVVLAGATSRRIYQGRGNASPATSGKSPDEEKAGRFVTCALYMARIAGILHILSDPLVGCRAWEQDAAGGFEPQPHQDFINA